MPKMRLAACAVVILATLPRLVVADEKYESRTSGFICTVTVSSATLEASPSWDASADGPPISLRQAIDISEAMKDSLVKNDQNDRKLQLRSASLKQSDVPGKWYWLIEYAYRSSDSRGTLYQLRLAVPMDGNPIKPVVFRKAKPR